MNAFVTARCIAVTHTNINNEDQISPSGQVDGIGSLVSLAGKRPSVCPKRGHIALAIQRNTHAHRLFCDNCGEMAVDPCTPSAHYHRLCHGDDKKCVHTAR